MENIGFAKTKPFLPTAPPYSVNANMIFAAGKLRSISNTSTVLLYSEKIVLFQKFSKYLHFLLFLKNSLGRLTSPFLLPIII